MKSNLYRAKAEAGKVQFGTWLNLVRNPAVLTLLKSAGLDFARVDMEHSAYSFETVADMAVLSRALDFPIAVRPPDGERGTITRLLDSGIWNLHVPQVDTPEQAYAVAQAARYAPDGQRGMSALGPHLDFEIVSQDQRVKHQNAQIHITVMLETKQAFDQLDEIASVKGVNALTLGPGDLAQDLGILGKPEQGKVLAEYRMRVIEAAKKHGKQVAMLADNAETVKWVIDHGGVIITYSGDAAMLHGAYTAKLAEIKAAAGIR